MRIFLFILAFLTIQGFAVLPAHAAEADESMGGFKDILDQFRGDIEEQSEELSPDGDVIEIPTFADEDELDQNGALSIVAGIERFMDFFKLIVAPVAVLAMVIMGMRLVTAGRDSEEVATKAKTYIRYALEGLIVIFVADQVVNVMFGFEGEIFRGGEAGAQEFGRRSGEFFQGLYSLIQVIMGSVAVFVLVMAGMRYVAGSASDDQIGLAKKQITWALVGLFIIGISEFVAKDILFPDQGQSLGVNSAEALFADVTNFIAGTIGTLSFAFILYGGYLYVTAAGNDDQVSKAKKIVGGALIGILIAASAFAITNTIVELDATR